MLYTYNGSIPSEFETAPEGWTPVDNPPECPEGKEVVWWYPPGWVVRDPKPEGRDGYVWKWNQDSQQWVEYERPAVSQPEVAVPTAQIEAMTSTQPVALSSEQISALE